MAAKGFTAFNGQSLRPYLQPTSALDQSNLANARKPILSGIQTVSEVVTEPQGDRGGQPSMGVASNVPGGFTKSGL